MRRPDGMYYATGQYPASDDQNATVATIIACDCEVTCSSVFHFLLEGGCYAIGAICHSVKAV